MEPPYSAPLLRAYRRHVADCPHAHKGAAYSLCSCPIWCDGKLKGQRLRRSLDTTDWARAQTRIELLTGGGELWDAAVPVTSDTHTLAEALAEFEADCRVRNLRDSTIGSYLRTLRQFHATVGNIAVNRLNLDTLERFRRGRMAVPKLQKKKGKLAAPPPRPVTPGTQRKEIETLRAFCAFCVAHKWMPDNPAKAMKPPKLDRVPTMPFEPAEVKALLAATDELYSTDPGETPYLRRRARVLIQALLYSGLRISDVSTLRRSALHPETGHLVLRTAKTGAPVKVKLPPHVIEAIQSLPARHPDYVFWSGDGDVETCVKNMRRTLLRLGKLAGVAKVHPHRFRDTFACRLLQHGADIRRVQLLLGHDSLHTTEKHYAPWVASHQELLDEAADLLDFEKPAARKPVLLRKAKRS